MQIAAMNPIAIDEAGVPESVKQEEINVAIEKTKAEQVQKAVEAALKKPHQSCSCRQRRTHGRTWLRDGSLLKT